MPGEEWQVWQKMLMALIQHVYAHSGNVSIKTVCVILFATSFIFLTTARKKKNCLPLSAVLCSKGLYDNIKKAQKPEGNGKGGTYFGATGCGKSFTMLYLTRLLMKSEYFESPTIVLITDRTDLDDQLSGSLYQCQNFHWR
jgi:type I restriction enzyme, R subunit